MNNDIFLAILLLIGIVIIILLKVNQYRNTKLCHRCEYKHAVGNFSPCYMCKRCDHFKDIGYDPKNVTFEVRNIEHPVSELLQSVWSDVIQNHVALQFNFHDASWTNNSIRLFYFDYNIIDDEAEKLSDHFKSLGYLDKIHMSAGLVAGGYYIDIWEKHNEVSECLP